MADRRVRIGPVNITTHALVTNAKCVQAKDLAGIDSKGKTKKKKKKGKSGQKSNSKDARKNSLVQLAVFKAEVGGRGWFVWSCLCCCPIRRRGCRVGTYVIVGVGDSWFLILTFSTPFRLEIDDCTSTTYYVRNL